MDLRLYKRYDRFYPIGRRTICAYLKRKLCFSGEEIPSGTGPMFILCNHNTDVDFLLLATVSKEPLDYVATETMLRISPLSKFAARTLRPILHDKGSKGMATIRQIVSRIKDGRNVVLFPEGNRSFDGRTGSVSDAIGKIVKTTGATLVVYRITGGYLTSPRWGSGIRKGKMQGRVMRVISPKMLSELSPSRVRDIIEEGLYTDAYKEQEKDKVAFVSNAPAEHLERLLFVCPSCRKIGSLVSAKDRVRCLCGYELTMDEYGYLKNEHEENLTVTQLFEEQKKYLRELLEGTDNDLLWDDDVRMMKLSPDHKVTQESRKKLTAYPDRIMIGDYELRRDMISSVDIVQSNRLIIHVKGEAGHLELLGEKTFNAVKYQLWFERSFP